MIRLRGFSLLEIMLALIVVSIGIGVLLTFSTASQHETTSKATGNDYSVVVNKVLDDFTTAASDCNDPQSNCILHAIPAADNITVYDYLCGNNAHNNSSCSNGHISAQQSTDLASAGVDLTGIKVTIVASRSDN